MPFYGDRFNGLLYSKLIKFGMTNLVEPQRLFNWHLQSHPVVHGAVVNTTVVVVYSCREKKRFADMRCEMFSDA